MGNASKRTPGLPERGPRGTICIIISPAVGVRAALAEYAMFFKQLFDPESSTLTYLIADDTAHEAVMVDPVAEQVERDVRLLREHGLKLKYTLETHVHADHVTA